MMQHRSLLTGYMAVVLAAGFICVAAALNTLPWERLDLYFLLLFSFTIFLGSRMTLRMPRFRSHIAVSDTFIFLALLIYGGEIAIVLSALEAFFSSRRFCRKYSTVFFNCAGMAVSTTGVVVVLNALGLYSAEQLQGTGRNAQDFLLALMVIALTQFIVNTVIAAVYDALKNDAPVWSTWKSKYVWSFLTFLVAAPAAGLLAQMTVSIGFGVIVAAFPVILFIYLSYRMYLANVEISVQQAEQAEKYAAILEEQSSALRQSEERFRSAFDYAPIGIALVSPAGNWLKVNHALCKITGYSNEELLSMNFQSIIFPADLDIALTKIQEVLTGRAAVWQMEQRYIHKTGRTVWASWSVSSASDSNSADANLIFQIQDITEKKLSDEKLRHEATHDALTGLANRPLFMGCLTNALHRMRVESDYSVSVLFIDLDRFKYVNDSWGHLVGDELLVQISQRLRECMRPSDMVARFGGDEFVIMVQGRYETDEVIRIAERIQEELGQPFSLRGCDVYSSASIGILHASDRHRTSEDMMRDADTAMYQAKRAGKARHEIFDEEMHTAVMATLQLETDLRRAVENDDFTIVYQPVYSLLTGEIEGLEALARWHHPTLGEIPPRKFLALADEIGLIDTLSEQILRKACSEVQRLKMSSVGMDRLTLSMSLSSRQFARVDLIERIENILADTGFSSTDLIFEITESVFFEYQERAIGILRRLRELGIELSVDDFGTGHSNLSYLLDLPISTLKIDGSFLAMIDRPGGNPEIVRAIVMLARSLGLRVLAEGVETQRQIDELRELNCDGVQGRFFAAPMSYEDVRSFIQTSSLLPDPPIAPEVAAYASMPAG